MAKDNTKKEKVTKATAKPVTTKVRVIKDTTVEAPKKIVKAKKVTPKKLKKLGKEAGYFKGAWQELRQVKWPTRRLTWSLTFAVIVFTAVLMIFIVGIDYVFNALFKKIIG